MKKEARALYKTLIDRFFGKQTYAWDVESDEQFNSVSPSIGFKDNVLNAYSALSSAREVIEAYQRNVKIDDSTSYLDVTPLKNEIEDALSSISRALLDSQFFKVHEFSLKKEEK